MEFGEVVRSRRMVRNYRSEPVERSKLERILRLARRVPSAGFSQGHYFLVVTDDETRAAIARLGHEESYVEAGFDPWMSKAPVHVVVGVSEADYHRRYQEPDKLNEDGTEIDWPIPYWWIDVGGALLALLWAAVDEGLVAGFFGVHRLDGLKELLGVPEEISPIGVVTIGYPAPDRRSGSLTRGWKPLDQVVHWERWGN